MGEMAASMKHPPEELRGIAKMLPDKYFCNFSLFQSLPDSWAIDQVFPIMPIQHLDQKPGKTCTIQDITCDSDGKIANFITLHDPSCALPVHAIKQGEKYYLGVFLVGAYQEILGDMHNLFGDTNAVHINVYPDHYDIDRIIDGETVAEVLDYVQFSAKKTGAQRRVLGICIRQKRRHHRRGRPQFHLHLPLGAIRIHIPRKRLNHAY